MIGADSLGYLSVESVRHIADGARCDFCCGCFTGEYPAVTPKEMDKSKFEQKIKKHEKRPPLRLGQKAKQPAAMAGLYLFAALPVMDYNTAAFSAAQTEWSVLILWKEL